jgi:predicted dehydrogenase
VRLDAALGGGALWDVGCYPVGFGQLLAASPARTAAGWQVLGGTGVDETFTGVVTYDNGVVVRVHAGFRAAYDTFLRIVGTTGVLEVARPFRPRQTDVLTIRQNQSTRTVTVEGHDIFIDEVADMEDAVLGISAPRVTLDDTRRLTATLEALYRSARAGSPVTVEA